MALKGDRLIVSEEVTFSMNEVAEKGGPVCLSTGGSGAALDSSSALVTYSNSPSGKLVVGILGADMVNINQTRQKINSHKNEVQKGGKVNLFTEGWVLTDRLANGVSPSAGDEAFATTGGLFTNTGSGGGAKVGHFMSSKDEDGYLKVWFSLPSKTQWG